MSTWIGFAICPFIPAAIASLLSSSNAFAVIATIGKFQEIAQAIADGIMETIGDENEALKGIYRVQIGLYRNFSNAQYVLNRAVADGYEGNIVYKDPYYAVQIGEYNTLDEAVRLENELKKKGYDTLVIKE